jgi:hypothetical protein
MGRKRGRVKSGKFPEIGEGNGRLKNEEKQAFNIRRPDRDSGMPGSRDGV